MRKIYFVALAALTMFSCSKENSESPESGDTKNVTLTIRSAESVNGRASEGAGTAHETPINDFTVYFLNSAGGVAVTHAVTELNDNGQYKFEKVTGLATKIFIVANTSLTETTLTGSTLDLLKANALTIAKYQKGIDNVIMAAADASNITEVVGQDGEYEAAVTIAPVVARLEIAQLEAVTANDASISDITDFTVANIYVNGYYKKMTLGGTVSDLMTGSSTNFATTELKDEALNIPSTDNVVVPKEPSTVWAYQLFPGAAHTMVIQFSEIKFANGTTLNEDNGSELEDLCITVTAFDPATFAAANIYNVENIPFSSKNIGKPYEATKNISVTLSVTPWKVNATNVTLQ